MPLYAVSLLFSLEVQAPDAPAPLQELAIHLVSAANEDEANARGQAIGKARETHYKNRDAEIVCNIFKAVVEVRQLMDDHLFDGMEVASWMFRRGERIVIDEDGTRTSGADEE